MLMITIKYLQGAGKIITVIITGWPALKSFVKLKRWERKQQVKGATEEEPGWDRKR